MSRKDDTDYARTPKRPRLMAPPDGFTKSKPKSAPRTSAPRFTSAFAASTSGDDGRGNSGSNRDTGRDRPSRTPAKLPAAPEAAATNRKPKPPMRALKPPIPLLDSDAQLRPAEPIVGKRMAVAVTSLRPIQPPVSESSSLRPLKPPPPPGLSAASSSKLPLDLKPLAPPPRLPVPAESPQHPLRTISTTHIARATDLFTDSGNAELASIFLRDQHPDIHLQSNPENIEERRGVMLSPEKGSKGKNPKFLRNGLASHASALLSRTHAALSLWQKETEHQLSSSRRPNPDMRLRIVQILQLLVPSHSHSSIPQSTESTPGVALCRLLSSNVAGSSKFRKDELHVVVLSFSLPSNPQSYVRNPDHFVVGRELCVWTPWQLITLPPGLLPQPAPQGDFLPSGTPLVPSTFSYTALVCSRFHILH